MNYIISIVNNKNRNNRNALRIYSIKKLQNKKECYNTFTFMHYNTLPQFYQKYLFNRNLLYIHSKSL